MEVMGFSPSVVTESQTVAVEVDAHRSVDQSFPGRKNRPGTVRLAGSDPCTDPYCGRMKRTPAWLPTEAAVDSPPARGRRDWVLAAMVAATAIAEAVLRDGMVWRPAAVMVGLALACAMLWRRSRPLAMVGLGFGAFLTVDVATLAAGKEPIYLIAGAAVVVLVYALFRWGTTRQAAAGSVVILIEWLVSVTTDFTGATDALVGLTVLLLAGAVGTAVRYQRIVRVQRLDQVRFHERDTLARELHDTVAHHVSAIAVQAQAGQFLAHTGDPDGPAEALAVIEQEASRALAEMRSMVGGLRRDHGGPEVSPARGVADIESLATRERATGIRIDVERRGDLDGLRPGVEAALFRIAQESITNAKRHARHATRIYVLVAGDRDRVHLGVTDDGEHIMSGPREPGYGLVGMAERVSLLGGSLEAGPNPELGWTVQATIPREGAPG
jgi:signal transduction histidine kinase